MKFSRSSTPPHHISVFRRCVPCFVCGKHTSSAHSSASSSSSSSTASRTSSCYLASGGGISGVHPHLCGCLFILFHTVSLSLSLYLAVVLDSRESKAGRTPHVVYISYCQVKRRCDTSRRAVYKSTKLIFGGVLRAPCFVPRASCHIAPTPPPHLDPIPSIPSVVTHEKSAGVWLILKIRSRQGPCGAAAYVRHVITEPYSPRP